MGTVSSPRAHGEITRPILLTDPGRAWFIDAGHVDLFLVDVKDNAPAGPRFAVVRLEAGRVFCGMDSLGISNSNVAMLASIAPDAALTEWTPAETEDSLIAQWIEDLTAAAATRMQPRMATAIEEGEEFVPEAQSPTFVRPASSALWVQVTGEARFLGEPECALDENVWFPLAANGWIELAPGASIRAVDWGRWRETNADGAAVNAFQRAAIACFVRQRSERNRQEADRLRARRGLDASAIKESLVELSSPVEPDRLKSGSKHDLLLAACREVARAEGLTVEAPHARPNSRQEERLADIAKASGFRIRRVMLRGAWWKETNGGMVGFIETGNTPVALLPRRAGYELFNPEDGSRTRVTGKLANSLSGAAVVFYRSFPRRPLNARVLLQFSFFGSSGDLLTIALVGLLAGALGMVTPIVTGDIFDTIIPGAQRPELLAVVLFTLAAAISASLLNLGRSIAVLRMESRMSASVQAAVWDRILDLPASFFRHYSSGDLALRSLGINRIREMLTGSLTSSILTGIFSLFSFGLLFYYDVRLALIATALVGSVVAITVFSSYYLRKVQRSAAAVNSRLSTMVLQFLNGIAKLRVSGAEGRAFALWSREFAIIQRTTLKARNISTAADVFNAAVPVVSSICIFYAVWHFAQDTVHPLTTGQFLAFITAFGQFFGATLGFSAGVQAIMTAVPAFERAKPILEATPEVDRAKVHPGELSGKIEINQVVFGYRSDLPPVLDGVSISVMPGQFVAIVGPSGCGKSTLFRLLLGFDRPQSGAIYYDGQDLATLDVQAIRKQIGTVLQTSKLSYGDIFRNIVGDLPLTIDDAWEAARLAGLEPDIQAMAMGMHTIVQEGGGGLSGGQRQRLMIARAIVSRPRILLFDEATSALDNETQAIVTRSLQQLAATRLVIAHRLSTVMHADRIFVLKGGHVIEHGTYGELMENNGLFSELARRQLT